MENSRYRPYDRPPYHQGGRGGRGGGGNYSAPPSAFFDPRDRYGGGNDVHRSMFGPARTGDYYWQSTMESTQLHTSLFPSVVLFSFATTRL